MNTSATGGDGKCFRTTEMYIINRPIGRYDKCLKSKISVNICNHLHSTPVRTTWRKGSGLKTGHAALATLSVYYF